MVKKAPRRTAERILEVTLELFNRFGEPNVSTTLISAELNISPGNLYYHYPAKDELINALFDRYEHSLGELLNASDGVRDVEDAWFFMHTLFELIWQYRFLYRDLNDLLSKNRRLKRISSPCSSTKPAPCARCSTACSALGPCRSTRANWNPRPPAWSWC